ncbi:hypothetical protein ACEV9O_06575 [Vibrio parahaemolyticus]|uniref:hypothetical protein n=1 Tax=Vibrio vulnificus TaxID=672 RepID=UPI000D729738|nr:hypothetical protein [Vibrio vulnificus]PWY28194.1 hypothetical protein VV97_16280 [Vibrio vulnificus]
MTKSVILLNRYELSKRVMSDKANAHDAIVMSRFVEKRYMLRQEMFKVACSRLASELKKAFKSDVKGFMKGMQRLSVINKQK